MADALPTVGGSNDVWGTLLNEWLLVAHNADGTAIESSTGVLYVNIASEEWGADPTGGTDCTSVIQAALNYLAESATSGVLYFPSGKYLQNGAVTWTSTAALMIVGDGMGNSTILLNNDSSNITYWSISNCSRLTVESISLSNNANSPSFADTNVGMYLNAIGWGVYFNVEIGQTAGASNRINQCVVINNGGSIDFGCCDFRSYVNCLVMQGTAAAVCYHNGTFGQNAGSGIGTAATVLMTGTPATLHLNGVYFNSGDRGLLCNGGRFIWMYDCELNNMSVDGMNFNTGTQVWAESCWIAADSAVQCNSSVVFASTFTGSAYFTKCVFAGAIDHNVVLGGGTGYGFTDCIFGDLAAGKAAANTYDELNIQDTVNYVTVHGCHFNTDPNFGVGSNKPRAAVYCNSGANFIDVQGNLSLPNGSYGTSALVATSANYSNSPVNMPYND